MKKADIPMLLIALFLPLLVGGIAAALSAANMSLYGSMSKPPLSPPAWLFPVAWTLLYLMMGLASFFVLKAEEETGVKAMALTIYVLQLLLNFMWPLIFFNGRTYLLAFVWLMILWSVVILCTVKFFGISRTAGWLMIPYIIWLTFAAYLNLGVYILNSKSS